MVGMKPDYPHSQHKMFVGKWSIIECSLFILTMTILSRIDLTILIITIDLITLTILTILTLNRRRGRTNGEEEVEG